MIASIRTNPLGTNDNWIGDGTEGATLTVDGSNIAFGSPKRGTPYNVRLESSSIATADNLYFEIEVVGDEPEGNLAVGLVTSSEFQPGWNTRGMFYHNGNLSNGAALKLGGFGDTLKAGHTIGVYLLRNNDECKVVFYLNGQCLGAGFVVGSNSLFYPCLHLDGKATVKYTAPSSFPATTDRQAATHDDPYSGDWILKQAFTGPELGELPIPDNVILSFCSVVHPNTYRLSIKVANTFHTSITLVGKMENFDKIEVGPARCTGMMPPPALQPLERFMGEGLETLYKMIVSDTGDLVMTGPAAEMLCGRYETTFEPLMSYN